MLTGCHVALILRGRQKKKKSNYFQMRISLSFSHVGTRGVSKLHKFEICAALSIFCFLWMPPTQQKKKE